MIREMVENSRRHAGEQRPAEPEARRWVTLLAPYREPALGRSLAELVWAFVHAKAKNVPTAKASPEGAGDIWTWTAICADTKLVPSWLVGARDGEYALAFVDDLRQRLANRVQLTSDGCRATS